LLEIGFEIQAVACVANGDGDRPAHSVVPLPLVKLLLARTVCAEPVPNLPLHGKAGDTALIPRSREGAASRHHLPHWPREKPPATQRLQEGRDRLLHSQGLVREEEQVCAIASQNKSFPAQ